MNTEKSLAGSARMGFDPRVGFGVFNTSQGSLSGAINEHLASGDPRSSLSTMGAASQRAMSASRGFLPNFQVTGTEENLRALTRICREERRSCRIVRESKY